MGGATVFHRCGLGSILEPDLPRRLTLPFVLVFCSVNFLLDPRQYSLYKNYNYVLQLDLETAYETSHFVDTHVSVKSIFGIQFTWS